MGLYRSVGGASEYSLDGWFRFATGERLFLSVDMSKTASVF
jgi:hypothetical protein